jgi:hypothetical protein
MAVSFGDSRFVAFSTGKPVPTPHQVRGRLFPENAPVIAEFPSFSSGFWPHGSAIGGFAFVLRSD